MKHIALTFALTLLFASCGANHENKDKEVKKVKTTAPIKVDVKKKAPVKIEKKTPVKVEKEITSKLDNASNVVWITDVNTAFKLSQKTNKPVFAFFTGKQWCGWCKKLVAQVLSKPVFAKYANENFIMLELDFPRRDRSKITPEMIALQRKFGVRGYPSVLLLDDKQNLLGKTGYQNMTPEQYVQHLKTMLAQKNS